MSLIRPPCSRAKRFALTSTGSIQTIVCYGYGVEFALLRAVGVGAARGLARPARTTICSSAMFERLHTLLSSNAGMRRAFGMLAVSVIVLILMGATGAAETVSVHVQRKLDVHENVHITFHARRLAEGGYYYAVIVLKPYKNYTRTPPPCATSSDMQRTDYGYPQSNGEVALALTPAKSRTGHWCPGGDYLGGIYAVPHAPPCESTYPCRSEPYKEPCAGIAPGCAHGVVARPREWAYPQGLPLPRASGTAIVGYFRVRFLSTRRPRAEPKPTALGR